MRHGLQALWGQRQAVNEMFLGAARLGLHDVLGVGAQNLVLANQQGVRERDERCVLARCVCSR